MRYKTRRHKSPHFWGWLMLRPWSLSQRRTGETPVPLKKLEGTEVKGRNPV